MARTNVTFVPSFVQFAMNNKIELEQKPEAVAFRTARTGQDKLSEPVTIMSMHYDKVTESIKVMCDDGKLRECRVQRLPSIEQGRLLWRQLQNAGAAKTPVKFVAAGGFNPDRWFYTFTE